MGRAYFPRTDPGQFIINVRMPSGTRLEVSNDYIAKVEDIIRSVVKPHDLGMIVSNIGVSPDLSAIYTPNASMDTAFVQTSLKEDHSIGSYDIHAPRAEASSRARCRSSPPISRPAVWWTASLTRACPRRSTSRSSRRTWRSPTRWPRQLAAKIDAIAQCRAMSTSRKASTIPAWQLNIDRERASLIGLSAKEVVDDVITALTSSGMVAPSYWIDPNSGNNYMVTVQYANRWINHMSMEDLRNIPLRGSRPEGFSPMEVGGQASPMNAALFRGAHRSGYVTLGSVADIRQINTPTEVDHNQIRRVIDIYVAPKTEALQKVGGEIDKLLAHTPHDRNTVINVRGAVVSMNESFRRFRPWAHHRHRAGLSDPDGAVRIVHRSVHHSHGHSAGTRRRGAHPGAHRQHAQHHVADGRHHDGRHRGLQQHSHRRVHQHPSRARECRCSKPPCRPARSACGRS